MIRIFLFLLACGHFLFEYPTLLLAQDQYPKFSFTSHAEYWPTNGWKYSTPEKQGMHSGHLVKMFRHINDGKYYINSVLVVKNGYIVAEADRNEPDHTRPMWSSTKGIISALVGIALDRGVLKSIDQPISDFFTHLQNQPDLLKNEIRLKHLLSMSAGIDWPEIETSMAYDGNPEYQMEMSPNWAEYVLARPMACKPGTMFNYSSGNYIVLTAVLKQAGLDVESFAGQYLFEPLGITPDRYFWNKTNEGLPNGSHGLVMCPRDMAKIGYLYLKGGQWDGKKILSKSWINASTAAQAEMNWKGFVADHYGYGWYLQQYGFNSLGYQGQFIVVMPGIEAVAVFTSELALHELELPLKWVEEFIVPADGTQSPIPQNKKEALELENEIKRFNDTPYW
ncbi:MAG: beta-lactamase family protein [Desulfobacterales bacterium]|nr:beta-lactamase family protein [Desulfobacterales bacterium]